MFAQKCGRFACGNGNREFLNDVWVSGDLGLTWTELFKHNPAQRWRPRGDHAAVIAKVRHPLTARAVVAHPPTHPPTACARTPNH